MATLAADSKGQAAVLLGNSHAAFGLHEYMHLARRAVAAVDDIAALSKASVNIAVTQS
ncbi:hypothetical protein [uncultured Pseudomonas sp.]|uniref:hypothetical protein n=1 Tax=uncultured Pseudomonas sp. TaxID=114707 RepID=UPI0030DCC189|tara:strand:+ start:1568 stop:1741 length:174 start_codon:yes stop_codon:yes gene_type:complete